MSEAAARFFRSGYTLAPQKTPYDSTGFTKKQPAKKLTRNETMELHKSLDEEFKSRHFSKYN